MTPGVGRGELQVIDSAGLASIQDACGRPGHGRFGVAPGGALDRGAARLADRLVGGDGTGAVLELTLTGPTLRAMTTVHIALTGADLDASADGLPLLTGLSHRLAAGTSIRFGTARPGRGVRGYLAIEGGFDVPVVLGSRSTDRRSGFGGLDGRPVRAGDVLRSRASQIGPRRSLVSAARASGNDAIDVVPTPMELGWFTPAAVDQLIQTAWAVAPDADRSGLRLVGGAGPGAIATVPSLVAGLPSQGMPVGAIQVPPSGEPIITLVDGPVTGGYPVIAVVVAADLDRLAQLAPGDQVRLRTTTIAAALARAAAADEPALELDAGDVAAGWAG